MPIEPFEVLSDRLGIPAEHIVKLDANENPYGPVPAVTEALARYPHFHVYPDPRQSMLRDALSAFIGVPAARILPGQGADELLDCLCRLFLAPGDTVINTPPTFGMYSFDAKLAGAKVVDVDRSDDFSVNVEAVAAAVEARRPKLLFLTSPNNPSGNWLGDKALDRLLALPVVVVLDEAYVEFADHASRASGVLDHDNLVVLRTFSKAAGIAGLRLGYGIFPPWLMHELWKFKQPYNVNAAASVAGIASLRNADQIEAVVEKLKAERSRLYALLAPLPESSRSRARRETSSCVGSSSETLSNSSLRSNATGSSSGTTTKAGSGVAFESPWAVRSTPTRSSARCAPWRECNREPAIPANAPRRHSTARPLRDFSAIPTAWGAELEPAFQHVERLATLGSSHRLGIRSRGMLRAIPGLAELPIANQRRTDGQRATCRSRRSACRLAGIRFVSVLKVRAHPVLERLAREVALDVLEHQVQGSRRVVVGIVGGAVRCDDDVRRLPQR